MTFSWPRLTWPGLASRPRRPHGLERRRRPPGEAAPCARGQADGDQVGDVEAQSLQGPLDVADRVDGRRGYRVRSSPVWRARATTGLREGRRPVRADASRSCAANVCGRHALGEDSRQVLGGVHGAVELPGRHWIGLGFPPGNSQACGRAARHQSRSSSSSCGEGSRRSDPAAPCPASSTRSAMRSLSMSDNTFSATDLGHAAGLRRRRSSARP